MSLDQVQNILLVLSGKGGVGKSSVTTQLALSLCLQGYSVGILDVDLTGPSIPRFLGIERAKVRQDENGWVPVEVHAAGVRKEKERGAGASGSMNKLTGVPNGGTNGIEDDSKVYDGARDHGQKNNIQNGHESLLKGDSSSSFAIPPTQPIGSLKALSLALLLPSRDSSIIWRGPKKTSMIRQLLTSISWGALDYLLIDTPPGTSDEHISLAEALLQPSTTTSSSSTITPSNPSALPLLRGAIVVTTPQAIATSDVKKELNFCRKTSIRVLGIVENMSGFVCPCCGEVTALFGKGGGEVMAREWEERFLGRVPVDQTWGDLIEGAVEAGEGGPTVMVNGSGGGGGGGRGGGETNGSGRGEEIKSESPTQNGHPSPSPPHATSLDLVERYLDCASYPIFQTITRDVLDAIGGEGGQGAKMEVEVEEGSRT